MLTTCFWGHLATFWLHCSALTPNQCPFCIQSGRGHWHIHIPLAHTSRFPKESCGLMNEYAWIFLNCAFTTNCGLPKSCSNVCQATWYIWSEYPMSSIAGLALPVTNVFKYCILWLSDALDPSTVSRKCPDRSGYSNGFPSNLSDTNLGNFIDTDTGGSIAGLGPKGKVDGGPGVDGAAFTVPT